MHCTTVCQSNDESSIFALIFVDLFPCAVIFARGFKKKSLLCTFYESVIAFSTIRFDMLYFRHFYCAAQQKKQKREKKNSTTFSTKEFKKWKKWGRKNLFNQHISWMKCRKFDFGNSILCVRLKSISIHLCHSSRTSKFEFIVKPQTYAPIENQTENYANWKRNLLSVLISLNF